MPGDILVTPAELRQHAQAVQAQAQQTKSEMDSMRSRLQQLSTEFRGQAATAFDNHWNEWHTHAAGLLEALDGLGRFLANTANTIEEVDQQIASGLNG